MTRPWAGVIFDLDGTLVDSLADIGLAMNAALVAAGLPPHPTAAYRAMVGEGADALVARAAVAADATFDRAVLATAYRAAYAARGHRRTTVYPGVAELLAAVDADGLALAVLSNKPDDFTRALVAERFPAIRFRAVWGQRAGVPRKPDPTAALALAEVMATPPDRLALVGDTAVDVATARAAGMTAIGALWGFRDRAELVAAGAHHLLAAPLDLLALAGGR